jgi:hypothetical protein
MSTLTYHVSRFLLVFIFFSGLSASNAASHPGWHVLMVSAVPNNELRQPALVTVS